MSLASHARSVLACCCAALALAGCGAGDDDGAPGPGRTAGAAEPTPAPRGPALAVGITEPNPALVWDRAARPEIPEPFGSWRDELDAIDPGHYRLVVDWAALQPDPDRPAQLDRPVDGCMRERPPCLGWAGLREQLAALASQQEGGGWEALVVLTGTPEWAAVSAGDCETDASSARARMVRADALPAYRRLIADVLAAAREEGASLRWWSAWNEPNHPSTLGPQHEPCGDRGSTPAVDDYVRLVRELEKALDAAPGEQQHVLGELARVGESTRASTGVAAFVRALPAELFCRAPVFGLHGYAAGRDPAEDFFAAAEAHACERPPSVWMTETGAGASARAGSERTTAGERRRACSQLHRLLREWYRDPRIDVAIQYTFREDDLFQVGLASTELDAAYPALGLWKAWGGDRGPADPPPRRSCGR